MLKSKFWLNFAGGMAFVILGVMFISVIGVV